MAFQLLHQKLVLGIALDDCRLRGYTDLTFRIQSSSSQELRLHSRQCSILSVQINGEQAPHRLNEPASSAPAPTMTATAWAWEQDAEQQMQEWGAKNSGELVISLPPAVLAAAPTSAPAAPEPKPASTASHERDEEDALSAVTGHPLSATQRAALKAEQTGASAPAEQPRDPAVFVLRVFYQLQSATQGLVELSPSAFFTTGQSDGPRLWMPCVDKLDARCTWDLELTCPANWIAVSCGELKEQLISDDDSLRTCIYSLTTPVSARSIGFIVSEFDVYSDDALPWVTLFAEASMMELVKLNLRFLPEGLAYLCEMIGRCPHEQALLKIVAVNGLTVPYVSFASCVLLNADLFASPRYIEPFQTLKLATFSAVASQWVGHFASVGDFSDFWLVAGLCEYFALTVVAKNDPHLITFFREKETERVADLAYSSGPLQALHLNRYRFFHEIVDDPLLRTKATLVFFMLETKATKEGLLKTVNHYLLNAAQTGFKMATSDFLKTLKSNSPPETDLKPAKRWIDGGQVAHFFCKYRCVGLRKRTEIAIIQRTHGEPVKGKLVIRIHETEGHFDHEVDITQREHHFEIPFRARTRRVRKRLTGNSVMLDNERGESPVLFIQVDPDLMWFRRVFLLQNTLLTVDQLRSTDVCVVYDAIQTASHENSTNISAALLQILRNDSMHIRVREEAALALANCGISGESSLIKMYKELFFEEINVSKPNDFSNFSLYALQHALLRAIMSVRTREGETSVDVLEFIIQVLSTNSNTSNGYADDILVATLMRAACLVVSFTPTPNTTRTHTHRRLIDHILKFRSLELMMATRQNVVLVSIFQFLCFECERLSVAHTLPDTRPEEKEKMMLFMNETLQFLSHSVYNQELHISARLAALHTLIRLDFPSTPTRRFVSELLTAVSHRRLAEPELIQQQLLHTALVALATQPNTRSPGGVDPTMFPEQYACVLPSLHSHIAAASPSFAARVGRPGVLGVRDPLFPISQRRIEAELLRGLWTSVAHSEKLKRAMIAALRNLASLGVLDNLSDTAGCVPAGGVGRATQGDLLTRSLVTDRLGRQVLVAQNGLYSELFPYQDVFIELRQNLDRVMNLSEVHRATAQKPVRHRQSAAKRAQQPYLDFEGSAGQITALVGRKRKRADAPKDARSTKRPRMSEQSRPTAAV
eukprot:TRINITY_DN692_c0_g1_i4.p1 TRINITY_DN692_c0_g1~~TRINITY_DN692_c0_g1_i4.p1  ORF type:complete len:1165 (+),score=296.46 TRINITY_DN692_c0_g1_i4:3-3497(+)